MALLHVDFFSDVLGMSMNMDVLLPQQTQGQIGMEGRAAQGKYKTMYLLHGMSDDQTIWQRRTSIERYVSSLGIAVVMPTTHLGFYTDTTYGMRYWTFLSQELPGICREFFPQMSGKREDTLAAGLSMGGRGAVKYAANRPELFAGAAVLSAVPVDFALMKPGDPNPFLDPENPRTSLSIRNAGGLEKYIASEENVWDILDKKAPLGVLPRLFFACGQEDVLLYRQYTAFQKHCLEIGLDADWFSLPGYAHEWRFWDIAIQKALDLFGILPVRKY